jgi:hypothetical protein
MSVQAVMPGPVRSDHKKTKEKTDKFRAKMEQREPEFPFRHVVLDVRYLYLDYQQRYRYRKHGIAKKHDTFKLQFFVFLLGHIMFCFVGLFRLSM